MTWTLTWTLVPFGESLLRLVVSCSRLFLEGSAVDIVGIHCNNARESWAVIFCVCVVCVCLLKKYVIHSLLL